jgi:hypothetical protein
MTRPAGSKTRLHTGSGVESTTAHRKNDERWETEQTMRKAGKNITKARQAVEQRPYTLQEAVPLLQKVKYAKFDETVEVTMRLGTRWCAAQWCCPTAWASRRRFW